MRFGNCIFVNTMYAIYFQAYVLSLTSRNEDRVEETAQFQEAAFHQLILDHDEIERDSQAILSFNTLDCTLSISGRRPNVDMAHAMVEQKLSPMGTSGHPLVVAVKSTSSEEDDKCMLHAHNSFSPGAESSHDSCYDSDGSPTASRRGSSAHLGSAHSHDDVSRTVSDTLAAEHQPDDAMPSTTGDKNPVNDVPLRTHKLLRPTKSLSVSNEYSKLHTSPHQPPTAQQLTLNPAYIEPQHKTLAGTSSLEDAVSEVDNNMNNVEGADTQMPNVETLAESPENEANNKDSSPDTDSSEEFTRTMEYASKVEFALKLGYTEEQLRAVLHKLGRELSQNELLSELIKIGSVASDSEESEAEEDEEEQEENQEPDVIIDEVIIETVETNSVSTGHGTSTTSSAAPSVEHSHIPVAPSMSLEEVSSTSAAAAAITQDEGALLLSALAASTQSRDKESSNFRHIVIDGSNVAMR